MRPDNARAKGQSDSGSLTERLRGEERLEDSITDVQRYARAIVRDCDLNHPLAPIGTRCDPNHAARCGGHESLPRIVDQVGQYLMDLVGVCDDLRELIIEIELDPNISSTQLKRQKFDCGLDDAVEG